MNTFRCAAAVVLLLGHAVAAQEPQRPQFRSGTDVVEVDAIVRDTDGRFVEGLTAEDFEIFEDGRPQEIRSAYLVRAGRPAPSSPDVPPAVQEQGARARRLFVLVFDRDHMPAGAFRRLRQAAERFLQDSFQSGDIGGIVSGGRMINDRLTTKRDELLAAVRQLKPSSEYSARFFDRHSEPPRFLNEVEAVRVNAGDTEALRQVVMRWRADDPGGQFDREGPVLAKAARIVSELRNSALETLHTLETVASELGRFPGRKTVVFLTAGFMIEENWARLELIAGRAARARVTFYTIDGRGLERRPESRDVASGGALPDSDLRPLTAFDTWEDAPNSVAVDSGGFVVRNTNDFRGALAQVADDTSTYYVLGYVPDRALDGSFRRIEVRVRRPGATVRARKGYVADPEPARTTTARPSPGESKRSAVLEVSRAAFIRERLQQLRGEAPKLARAIDALLASRPDESLERLRNQADAPAGATDLVSGLAYFSLRKDDEAVAALSRAVERLPSDPLPSFVLGWIHTTAGRDREAVGAYRGAAVIRPSFVAAHIAVADAYLRMDQPQLAGQALRAGLAANPNSADLKARLEALEKQQPEK